jgi:hypothetical protein
MPVMGSGTLIWLQCRLLPLSGTDGQFGVFQSPLAFVPDLLGLEPGIAVVLIDGRVTSAGDCLVPLDATDALQLTNTPNPFNPLTVILWHVPEHLDGQPGSVIVLDMHGREVRRLREGPLPAGTHQSVFDARSLPSGMYLYRIQIGDRALTRKMLLAK